MIPMHTLAAVAVALATLFPTVAVQADERDGRMDWWREARFGLFIHWGLYAIPAGTWNGSTGHAEWIRETAHIPVEEYEGLRAQFNPASFDADRWAQLAADAGMQYLVITSKHHDGFCLFDSAETDWDVANTPYGKDIMRQIADACRRHGLRIGWYHSIMDWHHPDYLPRRRWEDRPADDAHFPTFVRYLFMQVGELLTNYGPIDVMWFDGEWESTWNEELGQALYAHCRSLQPNVIVNNRVAKGRSGMAGMTTDPRAAGDFGTPEQEIPATGFPGVDWETCMTMNDHWGWNSDDQNWKSTTELIRILVDVASKGGNLLLNVGPTADGLFPPPAVERLEGIGAWMRTNGEAIHGTVASPFASLPFDGRCTMRRTAGPATLYLLVQTAPADGVLVLPGVEGTPSGVRVLGRSDVRPVVARRGADLTVEVPIAALDDPACTVVAVEFPTGPVVHRPPLIDTEADRFLDFTAFTLSPDGNGAEGIELRYTLDGSAPNARSPRADGPVRLDASATVIAQAFRDGTPLSDVSTRRFERLEPLPAALPTSLSAGLRRRQFALDLERLPTDLDARTADRDDTVDRIGIDDLMRDERVAMRLDGFLLVPEDGLYAFDLLSDDGSRLAISGQPVVDNDGLHAAASKRGVVALERGMHPIAVEWFNRTGGKALALRWSVAGAELLPVAPSSLFREATAAR